MKLEELENKLFKLFINNSMILSLNPYHYEFLELIDDNIKCSVVFNNHPYFVSIFTIEEIKSRILINISENGLPYDTIYNNYLIGNIIDKI